MMNVKFKSIFSAIGIFIESHRNRMAIAVNGCMVSGRSKGFRAINRDSIRFRAENKESQPNQIWNQEIN